ncbi:MAG: MmgE/PrpD family protein [Pseudomonadota bacterium]
MPPTYASHLNFDNLPVEVVEKAKTVILDTIGVILAAPRYPAGRLITLFAQNQGGRPQATILGGNCKVDTESAPFANGTMAHDMDIWKWTISTSQRLSMWRRLLFRQGKRVAVGMAVTWRPPH